ncbi:RICIN domain-containing protein [Leptolyngbya sp. GB1-A1]|uniref:hypothetical protein n=1 Tax=Leptolyngbya sp. GB1-A1 TaxID=2933908 RepID=UPI003298ACCF
MKNFFSILFKFLNQTRVEFSNRFSRFQRTATIAVLTFALILTSQQVRAFNLFDEINNCFSGGCDPTRTEVWQSVADRVEEVGEVIESVSWEEIAEYYNNPRSAYRALWGELANLTDTALNGVIRRNFGHVTNKSELQRALESQGIVIYGHEISQDDYLIATSATAASIATSNPAPLIQYFLKLANSSYNEMLLNLQRAVEQASTRFEGQYTAELQRLRQSLTPQFIATALATYVTTGEIPQASFNIDLSRADVRFGILTYSRGERYPGGIFVTPNTHQPYIIITPPGLGIRIEQTVANHIVPGEIIAPSSAFRIRNRWHPNCLASIGNSQAIDNPVVMGACGQSNAEWRWDGQQIRNGWHPNCLASIGNSQAIDNPVVMGACGQSNAEWRWDGQQIRNGWHPNCLASIGNSQAIDNPVVMGACGQSNAEWYTEVIQ